MLNTAALSAEALAAVLDQSVDCVKLIGRDGSVRWMNSNGLCAMEVDDFDLVRGQLWQSFWPESARALVIDALPAAASGEIVRFDAFCPTAKGTPRWWNVTVSRVTGVAGQDEGFLAISRDVTEAEMGRQAMLIAAAELRHRLKNTYAMIGSLIRGFARGNAEHEAFAQEMQSRLVSLSAAQALFSTQDVPCDIAVLVPALIEPFATPTCAVTMADFCDLSLRQGQADAIALALGELAVNSAKHGALAGCGTIHLTTRVEAGELELVWNERADAPVEARDRSGGQGLVLIERIVKARQGSIAIDWRSHGPVVTLRFAVE